MIFVTVGTNEARFDRLLQAVDGIGDGEPMIVQHGPSPVRPAGAQCVEFLSFDEMAEHMREARVVVTHAGVGSILLALSCGKVPVVAARLSEFGEAVDDHQWALARRLAERGLVRFVESLESGLDEALHDTGSQTVATADGGELARDVGIYIAAILETS